MHFFVIAIWAVCMTGAALFSTLWTDKY